MARKLNIQYIDIDDTGGNYSLSNDYTVPVDKYIVRIASGDTGTLSGNVTITATNAEAGIAYPIEFEDTFVRGAFSFTVLGLSLTAVQVANYPQILGVDNGSSFDVYLAANSKGTTVETANIADEAVTLAKMADLPRGAIFVGDATGRPSQADFAGSGRIPIGDGSDLNPVSMSGDATIDSAGVLTIAADSVDNTKLANIPQGSMKVGGAANAPTDLDVSGAGRFPVGDGTDINAVTMSGDATMSSTGALTLGAGVVTVAKAATPLKTEVISIPVSFETGEQCDNRFKMPYDGTLVEAYAVVTKAIAATDDATIQLKDGSGTNMTAGLITFTASDPLETAVTVTPTANNTFSAGDILYFTSAKATAGGKALLSVKITKS